MSPINLLNFSLAIQLRQKLRSRGIGRRALTRWLQGEEMRAARQRSGSGFERERFREPGESLCVDAPGAILSVSGSGNRAGSGSLAMSICVDASGAILSVSGSGNRAGSRSLEQSLYFVTLWERPRVPMLTLPRSMPRNGRPSALLCSAIFASSLIDS